MFLLSDFVIYLLWTRTTVLLYFGILAVQYFSLFLYKNIDFEAGWVNIWSFQLFYFQNHIFFSTIHTIHMFYLSWNMGSDMKRDRYALAFSLSLYALISLSLYLFILMFYCVQAFKNSNLVYKRALFMMGCNGVLVIYVWGLSSFFVVWLFWFLTVTG